MRYLDISEKFPAISYRFHVKRRWKWPTFFKKTATRYFPPKKCHRVVPSRFSDSVVFSKVFQLIRVGGITYSNSVSKFSEIGADFPFLYVLMSRPVRYFDENIVSPTSYLSYFGREFSGLDHFRVFSSDPSRRRSGAIFITKHFWNWSIFRNFGALSKIFGQ